jgi:hypothetical protein
VCSRKGSDLKVPLNDQQLDEKLNRCGRSTCTCADWRLKKVPILNSVDVCSSKCGLNNRIIRV